MATGGEKQVCYSLANVGTVTLENTNDTPFYISIAICQTKIIVLDTNDDDYKGKVKIHRLHDGKLLDMLDSDAMPSDICLIDDTTICILHYDGLIEMAFIKSEDMSPVFTRKKSFRLHGVFDSYGSIVRVNNNLVVVGVKQDTKYWCIASLVDGHVDTIHQICKQSFWSYVTTKDIIYISCHAGVDNDDTGVYAFDILNPSQCKHKYKHERLANPTSIVINEDGNIFVGNYDKSCIHQLTASCQLVAIFSEGIPSFLQAMFWDYGRLYVACYSSHDITVFRHEYQVSHKASEVLASHERKQPDIEKMDIQITRGNPIAQSVEKKLNQAEIKMSTEERDLFIKFLNEIGTDIYFSKGTHRLLDGQETLKATETFLEQNRPDMKDKWLEYKSQGKFTPELIDAIYAEERNPDLHANKDKLLKHMENLNIIVKARYFDENGVKEENYFFTPCMLHPKSEREVISPEQDPRLLSTTLCWEFKGTCFPYSIFDRLLATCMKRWPVAEKDTSEHLISPGYVVFDLDLIHKLTVKCGNYVIFATVTWLVIDDIKTPHANLCTIVRRFISHKLSTITDSLNQNLQHELFLQNADCRIPFAPFQMWFKAEVDDPDSPITREHINHARLYIALATVCGKALREMLLDNFPVPYKDIYKAILANHAKLTEKQNEGGRLLNGEQINLVFHDPSLQKTGKVEMFDISLLYILIRNVSTVQAPKTGWRSDPPQSDTSLGASVERIRKYRNDIGGHSPDAKIYDTEFNIYWRKFEGVLRDIEAISNRKYIEELYRHTGQVISIFNAC